MKVFIKEGFKYIFFLIVSTAVLTAQEVQTQQDVIPVKTRYGFEINRLPVVNFNIYADFDPVEWYAKLYLAVAIQNDILQFKKAEKGFTARYQITIAMRNQQGVIFKETWKRSTSVKTFELTNSRTRYQYSAFKIKQIFPFESQKILPGNYNCLLEVRDLNAKTSYKSMRDFVIPSLDSLTNNQPAASGITFLIFPAQDSLLQLYPTKKVIRFGQQAYAFFRMRTKKQKAMDFSVRIFLKQEEEDYLFYSRNIHIDSDSLSTEVLYKMPMDTLPEGDYRIRFETDFADEMFIREREFSVIWYEKPIYLYRADLAIRPMRYLLSPEEFERVNDMNYKEQEAWLDQYWREKDPTPKTIYNELLTVFYERVDKAIRQYSSRFQEGWETDRGRIFILYGEPDKIINNRYAANSIPHIVWIYKKENLEFIFVDRNGTGEFTLLEKENEEK